MFEGRVVIKGSRGSITMYEPSVPDFSLAGRRAIVTGASRGIGEALAVGLARFGADVAICARELSALERCRAAIEAAGRKAVPFASMSGKPDRSTGRSLMRPPRSAAWTS
jgi:hypothetical protein